MISSDIFSNLITSKKLLELKRQIFRPKKRMRSEGHDVKEAWRFCLFPSDCYNFPWMGGMKLQHNCMLFIFWVFCFTDLMWLSVISFFCGENYTLVLY